MVLDVPGGDSAEGMAIVERANVMKAAGSYGATSEFLAPKPSFFNILYTHPKFGAMPQWGEVQHRIKYTEPIALLPNLNSVKGAAIDPALRRATRVPWGQGQSSSAFLPLHLTQLPSSPLGKHPAPTPEMPVVDNYSALGKVPYHQSAPESLNPWVRNPPHRASTRQIYERLYGPEKKVPQKSKGVL
ncbi:hypothetical protein Ctob_014702 [Chrysochromulina tobinii]|uniref:Uncharacterized protein n=1 Tax=Chrysochromulina tobinii TaxID=1460289 RepID=A0A0M0KBM2_9EUKA|nr:hypothetical protein Ctob_014702 [Chrysochromulina tobinii]|eukprot:KOO35818.1 hypothetical protein Ctob_014702 [Chrysochromulina sp. CCMP291]